MASRVPHAMNTCTGPLKPPPGMLKIGCETLRFSITVAGFGFEINEPVPSVPKTPSPQALIVRVAGSLPIKAKVEPCAAVVATIGATLGSDIGLGFAPGP